MILDKFTMKIINYKKDIKNNLKIQKHKMKENVLYYIKRNYTYLLHKGIYRKKEVTLKLVVIMTKYIHANFSLSI